MTAIEKLWALRAENTERTRKMADRTDEWNAERAAKPPKEMTAEEATQHEEFLESFRSVLGEDFGKEPAEPREPFNSHRSQLEKELARDEAIAQRFLFLKREFGFTESEVKLFAGPGSALFSCTEDELREKIPYFIELFCGIDNFKRVVSRSDIDRVAYYRGILSYKDKELIEKKLCGIEKVFLTERKGAIDLMCQSAYYTYYSPEYLLRKIGQLAELLRLDYGEFVAAVKKHPYILQRSADKLAANLKTFASFFGVDEAVICEMLIKYPSLIYWNISDIQGVFAGKSAGYKQAKIESKYNEQGEIKKKIIEMPWILHCITKLEGLEYSGYVNFASLSAVCDYIVSIFGEVDEVFTMNAGDGRIVCLAFAPTDLRKHYTIVTIGNGYANKGGTRKLTLEQTIMHSIFGGATIPEPNHDEIVVHVPSLSGKAFETAKNLIRIMAPLRRQELYQKIALTSGRAIIPVPAFGIMDKVNCDEPPNLDNGDWQMKFISLLHLTKEQNEAIDKSMAETKEKVKLETEREFEAISNGGIVTDDEITSAYDSIYFFDNFLDFAQEDAENEVTAEQKRAEYEKRKAEFDKSIASSRAHNKYGLGMTRAIKLLYPDDQAIADELVKFN